MKRRILEILCDQRNKTLSDSAEKSTIGNDTVVEVSVRTESSGSVPAVSEANYHADSKYERCFLRKREFKSRKAVYISADIKNKISRIADMLGDRELSIGAYVENILECHLEEYKNEINSLYEKKIAKPL